MVDIRCTYDDCISRDVFGYCNEKSILMGRYMGCTKYTTQEEYEEMCNDDREIDKLLEK